MFCSIALFGCQSCNRVNDYKEVLTMKYIAIGTDDRIYAIAEL